MTLLCLPTLLNGRAGAPNGPQARVLMVQVDGLHFGFVVPRLCHIDQTVWQQPTAPRSAGTGGATGPLGEHALVEIGEAAAQRRTVHLIDLHAVARGLLKRVGGSAPAATATAPGEKALQPV